MEPRVAILVILVAMVTQDALYHVPSQKIPSPSLLCTASSSLLELRFKGPRKVQPCIDISTSITTATEKRSASITRQTFFRSFHSVWYKDHDQNSMAMKNMGWSRWLLDAQRHNVGDVTPQRTVPPSSMDFPTKD